MSRKNSNAVSHVSTLDAVGIYSGFCGVGLLPAVAARRGIAKPTTGGKGKPTARGRKGK